MVLGPVAKCENTCIWEFAELAVVVRVFEVVLAAVVVLTACGLLAATAARGSVSGWARATRDIVGYAQRGPY